MLSPKGDKILFTSDRSGDLELWTMNLDGSGLKQITFDLGYDGGAFFSPDGSKIVFRASRPKTTEEIKEYKDLLKQGLVAPTNMEIYVCNADGSNLHQVTHLGKANWAPFFHPSGKKIIFSSNHHSKRGYDFQLYMINEDGTPNTAHTKNPVPCVLVSKKLGDTVRLRNGRLADVAPTLLDLLGIPQPAEMTGKSLIEDINP